MNETELDKRAFEHYPFEAQSRERAIYCIGAIDQAKRDKKLFIAIVYNLMEIGDIEVRNIDKVIELINQKMEE